MTELERSERAMCHLAGWISGIGLVALILAGLFT